MNQRKAKRNIPSVSDFEAAVTKMKEKREQEKQLVSQMIALYCRRQHGVRGRLCEECRELNEYAALRSDKCPFMETKTFCSGCKVHCYQPVMREKIKEVMKFAGPRMLFYHPVTAIRHLISTIYFNRIKDVTSSNADKSL